jgi:hypothetical protein
MLRIFPAPHCNLDLESLLSASIKPTREDTVIVLVTIDLPRVPLSIHALAQPLEGDVGVSGTIACRQRREAWVRSITEIPLPYSLERRRQTSRSGNL